MAVSTTYTPASFNGNGATTAFAVPYQFFTGELVVTLIASTGVETVKTISTHYTVSGGTTSAGLPATGTVTMITAPASGETLRITRATSKTQAVTWTEGDPFPAKVAEAAFDRLTMIAQEGGGGGGSASDEITGDVLSLDSSGAVDFWDAESNILRNLADPTASTDAVTKSYGDTNYGGAAATAAAASAAAAATAETNAETAETNAETAETNAEAAQVAAAASAVAAAASAVAAAASADEAEAIVSGTMPAYTMKANIAGSSAATANATVAEVKTLLAYTATDISLGNVNNTSDADKPISTATQTALDAKVATTRAVNTSTGLSGGGALSADRTIALDVNTLTEDTTPDTAADFLLSWDTSASAHKKVKPTNVASSEWVEISDTTIGSAVASVEVTWTAGTYAMIYVIISDLSRSGAATTLDVTLRNASTAIVTLSPSVQFDAVGDVHTGWVEFAIGLDATTKRSVGRMVLGTAASGDTTTEAVSGTHATSPDRVRVAYSANNIDDGRIIVKGLKA